ncbi:MAG: hypothetical protein NZL85_04955 [Fimbriimonadales bacterium]|nr:hypothetical protein [Fimbriimonadales bacterium]
MSQRSGAKQGARGEPRLYATPLIKAHFRLPGSDALQPSSGSLVWHWRSTPRAATGWDMQARLHVCGLPPQFSVTELSQWRYLCEEWHLLGTSPELFAVADLVWLWLPSGGLHAPALLPRLRRCLAWLFRNQPRTPIILAGTPAAIGRRLTRWAAVAGATAGDCPVVLQADELETLAGQRRRGFYRLLQMCRDHPAQTR